jgi:hypothetical protein
VEEMKEKPILMTAENYRKCLDGTKTQTRRVIVPQPDKFFVLEKRRHCEIAAKIKDGVIVWTPYGGAEEQPMPMKEIQKHAPYPVGTRLWVKEPFRIGTDNPCEKLVCGKYTNGFGDCAINRCLTNTEWDKYLKWKEPYKGKSALFMFKSLARLWLEITAVRVERLQDISEADAQAEGITDVDYSVGVTYKSQFRNLWNSINGKKYPWESNPWVWVYEFSRIEK